MDGTFTERKRKKAEEGVSPTSSMGECVCLSVCLRARACVACAFVASLSPPPPTSPLLLCFYWYVPQPNRSLLKSLLQLEVNVMLFQRTSSPCRLLLLRFSSIVSALHLF